MTTEKKKFEEAAGLLQEVFSLLEEARRALGEAAFRLAEERSRLLAAGMGGEAVARVALAALAADKAVGHLEEARSLLWMVMPPWGETPGRLAQAAQEAAWELEAAARLAKWAAAILPDQELKTQLLVGKEQVVALYKKLKRAYNLL